MLLHSPDFQHNATIPQEFTCDGANESPTLIFDDIPDNTKSFVLIMDDPDVEFGRFVHWMVWNIPPETRNLTNDSLPEGVIVGIGSSGKRNYVGPCPPKGTHHYEFHLYAINKILQMSEDATRKEIEEAIAGSILDQAKLVGVYSR